MHEQYAQVIVNITTADIDRPFTYRIPEEMADEVRAGSAVEVPFGSGGRLVTGYVIGLSADPLYDPAKIKEIRRVLKDHNSIEGNLIRLALWMRAVYGSSLNSALKTVLPVRRRVRKRKSPEGMQELFDTPDDGLPLPVPDAEQQKVIDGIAAEWEGKDRPCLIRGVTGSGKTLVYMELIAKVLAEGKQAIVLIPEIALSWQTVRRFRQRFSDQVTVLNSRMSQGERTAEYEKMRSGEVQIVAGPRSALFAPFPNLGLIIIDEEQEDSYRSENAPRYDARETAVERARLEGAHVVLGSATPSVDSCCRCGRGEWALFHLDSRYGGAQLPDVHIVDMKQELREGNRSVLSRKLKECIAARLEKKEQVILFLNRRGYNSFVSCRSCGHVIKCPHCDVSLTQHAGGTLICHYCGYKIPAVKNCPVCGSQFLGGAFAGTQKAEAEVRRCFPEAAVLRMDADTTRRKNDHSRILKAFAEHEADILIGTQMIVKGHDFPDVTLVGALDADQSLFMSDYRAAEKTYQLLVQASGRAGRRGVKGEAVIQTCHPEHYALQNAALQDYDAFYEEEIVAREMLDYPPAANLLAIHGSGPDEEKLDVAMQALRSYLRRFEGEVTSLVGPAPETVKKVQDIYREVLYVKCPDFREICRIRKQAEKFIEINTGFHGMFFQYDLNA